jgi:hypothetical protein
LCRIWLSFICKKAKKKVVQTFPIFFVDLVVRRLVNDVEDVRTRKNRTSGQAQFPLKEPVQEHQIGVQSRLKILLKEKTYISFLKFIAPGEKLLKTQETLSNMI